MFPYLKLTAAALAISLHACDLPEGHPPVARISAAPTAIPVNDGFQSPVTLDGSASADPIDDPDATRPLSYRWEIIGDEFRLDSGSLASPTVTLRLRGERPATLRLTVTDEDGLSSTASEQLQLTLP